jgi:hypothetical protein
MIEKESDENQRAPLAAVGPGMKPGQAISALSRPADGRRGNGGARRGAGRPSGVPNKITTTFRDALLQARCS